MKTRSAIFRGLFLSFILFGAAFYADAQVDDTATREITSLDFQKQRPKGAVGAEVKAVVGKNATPLQKKNIAVVTNARRKYNLVKRIPAKTTVTVAKTNKNSPVNTPQSAIKTEQIGVTFWRLRPLADADGDVPIFPVRLGDARANWTAERVNSTTKFKEGDRVRFTIESSRSGYLYIVNREFYTDGTSGTANIIFPTLRTRGGDNRVAAGSLIDVPASTDSVPYFTVRPKRKDYAGEELVVLITNEKLPLELGLKPIAVNAPQLEKWSADWGATVDIYDAEDGEGIAMTNAELTVSQTSSRSLEQDEPLPQTIYKIRISPDAPLFVPFRMSAVPKE